MTVERHIELQDRLREVLGDQPAATLWSMLPGRDDLATKTDLSELENSLRGEIVGVRGELKGEISELRSELASLRSDMEHGFKNMEHRFATKDDLFAVVNQSNEAMQGYVRTFVVVQAATVVGMSGILFGLLRFF